MGKTKTAFVGESLTEDKKRAKPSSDKKASARRGKKEEPKKIHISGLKGGQRIKVIDVDVPPEETPGVQTIGAPLSKEVVRGLRKPKLRSKKYQEAKTKITARKLYPIEEAIKIVKETSYSKFDGTVELHLIIKKIGLSVNISFPHPFAKEKKIEVADEATIKKLETGKIDYDILLATVEFMPRLVPFAKILGPKGLMPNPKNGTLIKSAAGASKFSANTVVVKTEKDHPLIHLAVGKVSQKEAQLSENIQAVLKVVDPKSIVRAYLKSSMSPSVKLALN